MAQAKRIAVILPEDLLVSVDGLAGENRSAFVREALRLLIRQRRRIQANLHRLRRGYEQMSKLNLELAEEGIEDDLSAIEAYERLLAEEDKS